ncbi:MAG: polysaccharide pyruvyl transferase family protein [Candidatus Melainabacteria bacterium]|nr:polysaccharide pyruvyl transferase family protein [Candidatus Melainabacteria bacterium]
MESVEAKHLSDLPLETQLLEALSKIESFQKCALLDYPDHLNSGDHLIWLGTCFYLIETRKAQVTYTCSLVDFNQSELKEKNGNAPIFLQGGGNLGDIWPDSQKFREKVIAGNHDCPIYIMPQSIQFSDEKALQFAQSVFNAHPNLTIFTRDKRSYEFSCQYFPKAQSIMAPDMVFMLAPILQMFFKKKTNGKKVKWLIRNDLESSKAAKPSANADSNFVIEDWETYSWIYDGRGKAAELPKIYKKLPGSDFVARELWQRGLSKPQRLPGRIKWRYLKRFAPVFEATPNRNQMLFSWMIAFDAAHQIAECRLLITDRLHAHLTACILGVRNALIANSYHKNEQFFQTWNMQLRNSQFLTTEEEVAQFSMQNEACN